MTRRNSPGRRTRRPRTGGPCRPGEELVADYERRWLRQHARPDLADGVRWTAREDGDGLGYDEMSCGLDGRERYIEVKTTRFGAETLSTSPPPNWTSRDVTPAITSCTGSTTS